MAKTTMTWNNNRQTYRGETSDGRTVEVEGDEYSEAVSEGLKALTGFSDANDIPAGLVEKYLPEVYAEIDDPDTWVALVGDNPNVEFVKEK